MRRAAHLEGVEERLVAVDALPLVLLLHGELGLHRGAYAVAVLLQLDLEGRLELRLLPQQRRLPLELGHLQPDRAIGEGAHGAARLGDTH
eukprot:scaffold60529_cov61-Phaeocystis_antarctica.AAC.3